MKKLMPTKQEWVAFFVIMPLLDMAINYFMFGRRILYENDIWLYSFPIIFAIVFVSWFIRTTIMHWLRIKLVSFALTVQRLVLLVIVQVTVVSLTTSFVFGGYDLLHFLDYQFSWAGYTAAFVLNITVALIACTFWEADYTFKKWKESVAQKEQLEQLTIKHEFETLKSQVNPHFLFNCFNTLSSLISEDKKSAEKFLNELSKVYRYLLRSNEDGLSTLENELKFIQSYFELLKTRYGSALTMQIEVDKKYLPYLLPSLSLQLLVENAVKHNMVSRQSPLVIEIFTTAGHKLIVNNNIQPKPVKAPSNKVGLENIRSKYKLLNQNGFQVMEDHKGFCVVLPLVWNKAVEKYAELV